MKSAAEIRQQRRDSVRALFGTLSQRAIAVQLGVDPTTVACDCRAMGLKTTEAQRTWTPEKIETLTRLYATMTGRAVAEEMGLTQAQVELKISRLKAAGIAGKVPAKQHIFHWTPEKDAVLRARWATDQNTAALARELGAVSPKAVIHRASKLGIKKSPATKATTPKPTAARPPEPRKVRAMTDKELEAHERLRIRYTPETLPWQAYRMTGPVYVPPVPSHRGA